MNYFTNGYELNTAITNLFISFFSLISFLYIKKYKNKLWNSFFISIVLDGLIGFIIHGINMKASTINFYWAILLLIFCFTINILLAIFMNEFFNKKKIRLGSIILLSIMLYVILLIELILDIDFLITFIIYTSICLIFILIESFILIYKKNRYPIFYIFAIVFQIIGGLFLIFKKDYLFLIRMAYIIYI